MFLNTYPSTQIYEGVYIEKVFNAGVFNGVVIQLKNGFTCFSRELLYLIIYEDGDDEELDDEQVKDLIITDPVKIAQAQTKSYSNKEGTITFTYGQGVVYSTGSEPDKSVMIPKDVSPATTIMFKSIPTSTITNPYKKSGNMSGVSLSKGVNEEGKGVDEEGWTLEERREEARRCIPLEEQRRLLDGLKEYEYEICEEKTNQGKSSNSSSNKDNTSAVVMPSVGGSNNTKRSKLNLSRFNDKGGSRASEGIVYYESAPFQGSDENHYRLVFVQFPNIIWYIKAEYVKMVLETLFDDDDVPYWVTSMREIFIRKQPYGPNTFHRKKKSNGENGYPKSMFVFTHVVGKSALALETHSLSSAITKLHSLFANTDGLNEALHSWLSENQPGIISFFKKEFNEKAMLEKFDNNINKAFTSKRTMNSNVALDKFMLDWDIKQFIQNDLGLSNWPQNKISSIFGHSTTGAGIPKFDNVKELSLND